MNVRGALTGQYHAALAMLRQAIEQCPGKLWEGQDDFVPYWQVVYHTLYFTHLYLQTNEAAFRPWALHREGYHDLPWPPQSGPKLHHPYTKDELIDYWKFCDDMVDAAVEGLDLDSPESGISWHKSMPKLEHQLHNIRHIQHHAALLSGRLRRELGSKVEVRWVRSR